MDAGSKPGTVIAVTAEEIIVKTGDGEIALTRIQPSGKKAMDVSDFVKGSRILIGTIFGE